VTPVNEAREDRIKRMLPVWEAKRRECDERERREGVACVPQVCERPNYDEIIKRLRERDNFERAQVLLLVINERGVGEVLLERPDGKVMHARAKGYMEMGQ